MRASSLSRVAFLIRRRKLRDRGGRERGRSAERREGVSEEDLMRIAEGSDDTELTLCIRS